MAEQFDVIIIGAGNAGFGVSSVLAEAGRSMAFIERAVFGGVCPNRGCTPKKFLVAAAQSLDGIARAGEHGIAVGEPRLDWARLIERTDQMIDAIPDAMRGLAEKRGKVFTGEARFVSPDTIRVGDTELTAEHIVIATGSRPRTLPIPGAELMITSDEVLSEREQPGSVLFIGGGVIALEFSHVYARAGTAVTILEVAPRLLPNLDADAVGKIQGESERIGVSIHTGVKVERIERVGEQGTRLRVIGSLDGERFTTVADRVVNGAGRVADVDGLDLESAGVDHDGVRISLDENLRSTSNPRVWVAGDALAGSAQLSPIATYEGQIVGRNILDGPVHRADYAAIPSAVYTVPALASIGLTETQAREQGLDVEVRASDMTDWLSAKTYAETVAYAKVLVERDTDRIVGAHLAGHHGEDLIHLFAMAMRHGITATDMKSAVYGYPTFAADLRNAI